MSTRVVGKRGLPGHGWSAVTGIVAALAGAARASLTGLFGRGGNKSAGSELAAVPIATGGYLWESRETYK